MTPQHAPGKGSRTRYRKGCRCVECREAAIEYDRRRRARWTPEQRAAKKERDRNAYHANPARLLNGNRQCRYGIDPEVVERILSYQGNCCAICREQFTRTPNVDHDHTTGDVRGLLCSACNVALGLFKDNVDRLRAAVAYLDRAWCMRALSGGGWR